MDVPSVVIVDYGSQVTRLIARRVREAGVYSEIISYREVGSTLHAMHPRAIILSGGPSSVYEKGAPMLDPVLLEQGVPILAICYGMQLLTYALGGDVRPAQFREYGATKVFSVEESLLFKGISFPSVVWMSHGDVVVRAPEGFTVTLRTEDTPVASMEDTARSIYAVQFHPEVAHTPIGKDIIENFLFSIADLSPTWSMENYLHTSIAAVKEQVEDKHVLCALSGGVDSTVVAVLLQKAIGDRVHCFFVDTGLMRKGEGRTIMEYLNKYFSLSVHCIDARERFLRALQGITDPEEKRKIIGALFVRIFEEEAEKLEGVVSFLAQGTLYPDVIESVAHDGAVVIKSHHNVGGLPKDMRLALVEPLRELFKDEVRALGEVLGIPKEIVWRHPFPGPGLAVRIIGEVTEERLIILRDADAIVVEECKKSGYYDKVWQAFAVLLPLKTVGVMGDGRSYEHVVALRAVESTDAMTADWAKLPYALLEVIAKRIISEVKGVNRVVYDISSKPPSTIEWE